MSNRVRISPAVAREFLIWVRSLPLKPDAPQSREALAWIHLAAVRQLLQNDVEWKALATPIEMTSEPALWEIEVMNRARLRIAVYQPKWWQFWRPREIEVIQFLPRWPAIPE
jgi:hypothetical protein